jgi:hypothetical protein
MPLQALQPMLIFVVVVAVNWLLYLLRLRQGPLLLLLLLVADAIVIIIVAVQEGLIYCHLPWLLLLLLALPLHECNQLLVCFSVHRQGACQLLQQIFLCCCCCWVGSRDCKP